MRQFKKLKEAVDEAVEGRNVYHAEYPGGKHYYLCGTLDEFMAIAADGKRRVHETIHPDRPCRMFMDLECALETGEVVDKEAIVRVVCDALEEYALPEPLVLDGTREGKFSLHLVWDAWFANPMQCRVLAASVHEHVRLGNRPLIDMGVYKSGLGCLRMAYSSKLDSTSGKLVGKLVPLGGPSEFDQGVFLRSLIGYHASPLTEPPIAVRQVLSSFATPRDEVVEDTKEPELALLVIKWMGLMNPKLNPTDIIEHADGSFRFTCYAYCPMGKRWHTNNRQYVRCGVDGRVMLHCHGTDCKDGSTLIYPCVHHLKPQRPVDEFEGW